MSILPGPDPSLCLRPVSQLTPKAVEWLWPGRLPLGKLAILDGDPGLGKSLLALDLCARLSTGRPLPDNSPGLGPAAAIVLTSEDNAEDTVLPRLRSLGADLERTFVLHRSRGAEREPLRFPTHADQLAWALVQTGAALVVIDPITAFLDGRVNLASDQSIREALFPLASLAEKFRCLILLIRHLNKLRSHRALYRGGGSIGLVGACRAGWLVVGDPHEPGRVVLAQVKNNLAGPQPSLTYRVEGAGPAARLTWHGPCSWTADQLLAAGPPPGPTARDRASEFLVEAPAGGPACRDLWALGQKKRLGRRTLQRARREKKIRSERVWMNGQYLGYWLLPGQELPAGSAPEPATTGEPDLDECLARLREQFPPSSPLDDL